MGGVSEPVNETKPASPSKRPVAKVSAAGGAGAVATVVVVVLQAVGLDVSPELAAAIATLASFVAGYLTPPRGQ